MHLAPGSKKPKLNIQSHSGGHLSDIGTNYLLELHDRWLWKCHPEVWRPRTVMVGRYGYDEHQGEKFRAGKLPRDCEFTLAARDLGVAERPALGPLMDYILKVDAAGQGKGLLKFGRVVELLYNVYPSVEWWRVEQFTRLVIEASIRVERLVTEWGVELEPDPRCVAGVIRSAYGIVERDFPAVELSRIEPMVRGWVNGEIAFEPFGLPYCVQLLAWDFERLPDTLRTESKRWLVEWAADAMRAELMRQRSYLAAKRQYEDELAASADTRTIELVFNHRGAEVQCLFVRTENTTYHAFVFSEDAAAIAVALRRASRHVQIVRRRHGGRTVSLQFTAALLRAKEQEKRGYPISAWQDLIAPDGPKGAEGLFYHPRIGCVLNRFPDSKPTILLDGEIQECIVRGLADEWAEFREQFRREREAVAV